MTYRVELWTDGSGGRSGPVGYAWALRAIDLESGVVRPETASGEGAERDGTMNRAELLAVIVGLLQLKRSCKLTVISDSAYVVESVNAGRLQRWIDSGWKLANKPQQDRHPDARFMCPLCAAPGYSADEQCDRHAPSVPKRAARDIMAVANQDLWRMVAEAFTLHDISFEQVKGHTGLELNEDCDRRAGAARKALVAELAEAAVDEPEPARAL